VPFWEPKPYQPNDMIGISRRGGVDVDAGLGVLVPARRSPWMLCFSALAYPAPTGGHKGPNSTRPCSRPYGGPRPSSPSSSPFRLGRAVPQKQRTVRLKQRTLPPYLLPQSAKLLSMEYYFRFLDCHAHIRLLEEGICCNGIVKK